VQVHDAGENTGLVEERFEFDRSSRQVSRQLCLLSDQRFDVRNVAINLKHRVVAEQLHPAVYSDLATILADMAQFAGPVTLLAKLRKQIGELNREFGLQESMTAAPDGFVRCKPVKPFGPGVPDLDCAIQPPREHRLVGQHDQIGQRFGRCGGRDRRGGLVLHVCFEVALHDRAR